MRNFIASIRAKITDRKGVSAAEYAILAVGIVIVVGGAVLAFEDTLEQAFAAIGTAVQSAQNSIQSGAGGS